MAKLCSISHRVSYISYCVSCIVNYIIKKNSVNRMVSHREVLYRASYTIDSNAYYRNLELTCIRGNSDCDGIIADMFEI